ncbi:cytochrome c [Ideonella sp.]|uniref:c-type cytochrome n=1 Tax=Ideonella sp. TaxID=1929293 RepID=UPI0035B1D8E7
MRPPRASSARARRCASWRRRTLAGLRAGLLASLLGAVPAAWSAEEAGAGGGMADRVRACAACHGPQGRATPGGYFPRIAGKPAGYLYHQLLHFQAGRRHNEAMQHLLQHLSSAYLQEIAGHFASLDLPYPPAAPDRLTPPERARAERLVHHGAPERELPACASCHGQALAGTLPATPGLTGLSADYLIGQLGAWRTGQRRAHAPDCMAEVARRLSAEEVGLVARWLAARPPTPGARPAPAPAAALPLRCGSASP